MRDGLITHPDKVLFAERGETKGDLAGHYLRVAEPLMRTMGGRPVLLQRFPEGAGGPSFFQKRVPKNAPDWLQTTTVATPNGTTVAGAGRRRHSTTCCGRSTWAAWASTSGPTWPAIPATPTSCGSTSTRRRAWTSARSAEAAHELRAAARRGRHHRLPEDDRQPRPARVRPAAAALGLLPGARGRGGGGPGTGAAQARPDHRRLVEGGARPAGVRRLQPERAAQDGVRRVVGPGPAGRAGVHADLLGGARRHPPGPVHDRVAGRPARRRPVTRGWA